MPTDKFTETKRNGFTLLIDPPDGDWYQSSEGFLYCLKSIVADLTRLDPHELDPNEIHQRLMSILAGLTPITDQLVERMHAGSNFERETADFLQHLMRGKEAASGGAP